MIYLLLALLIGQVAGEEWDAENYPNPTVAQFRQCGMRTRASVCDPDGVLSEAERYRLDHELKQLEARTRQEHGASFCDKKGITAALAIARHVRGGSTEAVKYMANDMLRRWTLDSQCQKAIVIVVSTDDMKFWVARDDKVPVYADEFTDIFMQQKRYFQQSDYQQGISNVLKSTWEKAMSKAGNPQSRSDSPRPAFGFGDGGGGQQPYPPGGRGAGGGGPTMKMPSIPGWFWMALIFGIIPLLCCCLCCYFCCCRGKGGGATEPRQPDQPRGPGMAGGGGGGGRSPFSNLITSMGGAGIGSLIGNMISGRNRGGGGGGMGGGGYGGGGRGYGGGGGGYGGGGGGGGRGMGYDPSPVYDDNQGRGGRGLYPSAGVKDQGGGGGW